MLAFNIYGHFGIARWSKIRIFRSKPSKTECTIKSRVLIHFRSNFDTILILLIQRCWKDKISKNFKLWPPTKKSQFPRFSQYWTKISQWGFYDVLSNHLFSKSPLSYLSIDTKSMIIAIFVQRILTLKVNPYFDLVSDKIWLDNAHDVIIA